MKNDSLMHEIKSLEETLTHTRMRINKEERVDIQFDLVNILITYYNSHKNLNDAFKAYKNYLRGELERYITE